MEHWIKIQDQESRSETLVTIPRVLPTLKDRAELAVMKHRAKCNTNIVHFRAMQQRRREIGLDDWSGDIQMVLEALEGLERYHAEKEQLRLPGTH